MRLESSRPLPLAPAKPAAAQPPAAASAPLADQVRLTGAAPLPVETDGPVRRFTAPDGVKVAFRTTPVPPGQQEKVVVVHVPGLGSHSGMAQGYADALAKQGAAVYAIDNRGSGRTEGKSGDVGDYRAWVADVDRLVALAKAEHPGTPVVISGASMGALIATRYAQSHPTQVDGLVSLAPVYLNRFFRPGDYVRLIGALVSRLWDRKALDRPMATPGSLGVPLSENPNAASASDPRAKEQVTARVYWNVLKMTARNLLAAPLQRMPTFLGLAKGDPVNVNGVARAYGSLAGILRPGEQLRAAKTYENAGHDLSEAWHLPGLMQDVGAFVTERPEPPVT